MSDYASREQRMLEREAYEKHHAGLSDEEGAAALGLRVVQYHDLRLAYEARLEGETANEVEDAQARAKWREYIDLWLNRLDNAYTSSTVEIDKAVTAFDKLAKLGIQLDGLAKGGKLAKKLNVDAEIEKLMGLFPADDEQDLPL